MTTYPVGGVDWVAKQKAMQNWVVGGCGLDPAQVRWQQQDKAPRPAAPAVLLKISNIAEIGRPWTSEDDKPLTFSTIPVSAVDATANTFAATAHGLLTGDGPVHLASTGTLPTAVGGDIAPLTNYWIIAPDANHVQLARNYAGTGGGQGAGNPTTPIDLTGTGSGSITISQTVDSVRAGQELQVVARAFLRVTLELHCPAADGVGMAMATSILQRIRLRRYFPSQVAILHAANIGVLDVDRVRAILGTKDAVLFEPRAYTEIHFCVPAEEAEDETIIERVELTDFVNKTVEITVE